MSLYIGSGYLQVTDTDGDVCMDTRDALFHIISEKTGSQYVPNTNMGYHEASASTYTRSYDLGAIDAGCTDLIGFFKITFSGTGFTPIPDGQWWIAGGTELLDMRRWTNIFGTGYNYISCMHLLTFEISGGHLYLNIEWCHCDAELLGSAPGSTLRSYTVDYRIFCGAFT